MNVSLFGMWSYTGPIYIPSLMEIAVTAVLVKLLPVFPTAHELEAMPAEG